MLPIQIELPEGFLDEEVRCGYTVSAEMKKLWAVELDLLAEFDRVCRKHGLTYFVEGGTLLGAVRHKGFVPWDDDIDVVIPRRDYQKLTEIAAEEFRQPYFFQTSFTDPGLVMGGSRLRNSDTTLISDFENRRPYQNKGIFIDIFVLDNIPDSRTTLEHAKRVLKGYWRILRYASYYESYFVPGRRYAVKRMILGKFSRGLKHIFGIERLSRGYERYCRQWVDENTERVGTLECSRGRNIYQRKWFESVSYIPFESISVPVPTQYHDVLVETYGEDYMVLKRSPSLHKPLLFNAETPYQAYEAGGRKT